MGRIVMGKEKQKKKPHILIVTGSFYKDIAHMLEVGAISALTEEGASYDRIEVPGALEIPGVISLAVKSGLIPRTKNHGKYDGAIALGCIIRGETYHFEIVSNESSRGLTDLGVLDHIPIGNGILTVENRDQALARLKNGDNHKGEDAARACLSLIKVDKAVQKAK